MKNILFFSIILCAMALPVLAELTVQDLEKIDEKIQASEKRVKEYINTKNESIDQRLSLVTTLIAGLIALIVLAVGIPQILIAWRSRTDRIQSEKSVESFILELVEKRIEELIPEDRRVIEQIVRDQEEKIESLTQEIETLKQQRPVNP